MERPDRIARAMDELVLIAAGVILLAVLVLGPSLSMLVHGGRLGLLSIPDTLSGWTSLILEGRWGDPASAFAYPQRTAMPGRSGFWATMAWTGLLTGALMFAAARALDGRAAAPELGRAWWQLRGARPRAWARPRDLEALQVPERPVERMTLGTIGQRPRLLAAEEEMHVAVLAPTGAGKTSGLVIPWVLEAPGPVISLSVKPDVYEATHHFRAQKGRVWVWDPFGPTSCGWSPLLGCESWSGALRRAKGLADAGDKDGTSEGAVFWKGEGAKLLAPLLHAAAAHNLVMADVLRWLDERDEQQPMERLQQLINAALAELEQLRAGSPPPSPAERSRGRRRARELEVKISAARSASAQLEATLSLDSRNAGSTYMSAGALLAAYRYPEVQETETRTDFSAEALLNGQANTLYIVAGAEDQELLAPVIVALLTEVMALGSKRAAEHGAFAPTVRFVGDELTNIAPIRSLPRYLSTLRAPGFRFAIVAQNIAQLRSVYGSDDVDTIMTNCQAKLFLGPITCTQTIEYLGRVLGETATASQTFSKANRLGETSSMSEAQNWRPRAGARELQQLGNRRALLMHSTLPAAVIRTVPWWEVGSLKRATQTGDQVIPVSPRTGPVMGSNVVALPAQSTGPAREPAGGAA